MDTWAPLKGHGIEPVLPMFLHKPVHYGSLTLPGAMLVRPQPMCLQPKILECCLFWTKCPLSIVHLTEPSHPIAFWISFLWVWLTLCRVRLGKYCRGWRPGIIDAVHALRPLRSEVVVKLAPSLTTTLWTLHLCVVQSMHDAVQGWDTLVRGTISKGRFVQGVQHPGTSLAYFLPNWSFKGMV